MGNPKNYQDKSVRVVNVKPVNHFKWLMWTIITCGIAAPFWGIAVISRNMTK